METALIGYGYWGANLLRNLLELRGGLTLHVCDLKEERIKELSSLYPRVKTYTRADDILANPDISSVIIATPTSSHFELVRKALLAGKHVFAEKPLTDNAGQAEELMQLAEFKQLFLMVDHIYLYNGAVQKVKELLASPDFGKLQYIDATRINLGIYQDDVNVIWDLATHDLSIILELVNEKPTHVRTIGKLNALHGREDLAYLFLKFSSGLLVEIKSSWASPVKIRQIIFGGSKQMIIYDDVEPTQKIKVYNFEAVPFNDEMRKKALVDYRLGDISIPKFSAHEPLKAALTDFFDAIKSGRVPYSSVSKAIPVIKTLEQATLSLKSDGNWIAL